MKHFLQIILGFIFFILFVFSFTAREGKLSSDEELVFQARNAFPVEFLIVRLGIHAPIEPVGILDNAMAVPVKKEDVGWYDRGPRPGDQGSAVLAGHVNWDGGQDAVFASLHTIKIGDIVQVRNSVGVTDTFVVVRIKDYPMNNDTVEVFSSSDGSRRLNLITCDGVWDKILKTHRLRLVVFTEKINV